MAEVFLPFVLLAQGVLGGVDTLLNHEYIAELPRRPEAHTEIGLHVMREAIWALLFAGLAARGRDRHHRVRRVGREPHPRAPAERAHPAQLDSGSRPSALVARDFGVLSWLLSLLAAAAAAWSFRDFLAWRRLRRASVAA